MSKEIDQYLLDFGDIHDLTLKQLHQEMDNVWEQYQLDNKLELKKQSEKVSKFYSHPVWILNGIFSKTDATSLSHRLAIRNKILELKPKKVADYGGGSGTLAAIIAKKSPQIEIDIIEPYPFDYFKKQFANNSTIRYLPKFQEQYDICIAQDVLEHVDHPIKTATEIINSTKMGGHIIFANCFHPEIYCHLPKTFYLRHTFKWLMSTAGLLYIQPVPGAEHADVFKKVNNINEKSLARNTVIAKFVGTPIIYLSPVIYKIKRLLNNLLTN